MYTRHGFVQDAAGAVDYYKFIATVLDSSYGRTEGGEASSGPRLYGTSSFLQKRPSAQNEGPRREMFRSATASTAVFMPPPWRINKLSSTVSSIRKGLTSSSGLGNNL